MKEDNVVDVVKRELKKTTLGWGVQFNPERFKVRELQDYLTGLFCVRVTTDLFAERIINKTKVFSYTVPTSWWEMFKRDVLKMKNIKTKVEEIYMDVTGDFIYPFKPLEGGHIHEQSHISRLSDWGVHD